MWKYGIIVSAIIYTALPRGRKSIVGKAIAIFNQKGGVGKTTTNINLAACLALKGKKVLILDIDPQGNTTSGIGISKRNLKDTIYNILIDKNYDPRKAIIKTSVRNLDLIPASVDLAGAEVELVDLEGRESTLNDLLPHARRCLALSLTLSHLILTIPFGRGEK